MDARISTRMESSIHQPTRTPVPELLQRKGSAAGSRAGEFETPVLAIVFCMIWSSAFVATKLGLQSSPPLILASVRFLIAGPLMILIALALRHAFPGDLRSMSLLALLGVLNNSLYLGLTFVSLETVSAALVSFIATLNPLVTAALAHWLLGERINARKSIGLFIGVAGVAFALHRRLGMSIDDPVGVVLSLLGVTSLVLGTILFKRLTLKTSILMVSGVQILVGGLALLPLALFLERADAVTIDTNFVSATAYLALVASVVGTLIWFRLLQRGTASVVSAYHFLTPALGLLFAWAVLNETIVWSDMLGAIPISIGIMLVSWSDRADSRNDRHGTDPVR